MNWFSKYPNWLYSESIELSNNSIYKEKYQFIDRTLVSTGDIIVHKEQTEYYHILIVYPDATPYVPPSIYALENPLDKDEVVHFSALSPDEISNEIYDKIKFFNRRHQMENGSICFIEQGDFHNETFEKCKIKDILKRIRLWFSGKIPKDSEEVELYCHFKNRCREIQYLLPDLFLDQNIIKGKFYAGLSTVISSNIKKTYIGILLSGSNNRGIQLPPKIYTSEKFIFYANIPDPKEILQFLSGDENVLYQDKIKQGNIIEGYWWDIDVEPEPFSSILELAEYIGQGNKENGFVEIIRNLESELKQINKYIHIGLRFPGRQQDKDWQMFRLERGSRSPILKNDFEELKAKLLDYSISAVYQEYITEQYFHLRNSGRADRELLKFSNISIIGCGALGSEIADCLCKAGVGNLALVDREEMRAHNAIRHRIGLNGISYPKVSVLAPFLALSNPFVNIEMKLIDILKKELDEYFLPGFIGISTIADDNVESFLNENAVENGRTVFYIRALRGGKSARIFRVKPSEDACKNCLALYFKENNDLFLDIEEDKNLPVITNECNNPIRPASAADLKLIASIASRIIIDYLQGIGMDKNHWIFSTESLKNVNFDEDFYWGIIRSKFLPPHPGCYICQSLNEKKVYISRKAYELIKDEVKESKNLETGGVLIGYINESGEFFIEKVTKPGPKSTKTESFFLKDEEFTQKELEVAFRSFGSKGLYLGEWHYHPKGANLPSGTDIKSLTEIAKQETYRTNLPLLIILSPNFEYALTIHDKNGQCIQLPIKLIDDTKKTINKT